MVVAIGTSQPLSPSFGNEPQTGTPVSSEKNAVEVSASPRDLREIIRGTGSIETKNDAFNELVAIAKSGDATAAIFAAEFARSGSEVSANLPLAVEMYLIAVDTGNPTAARALGELYFSGNAPEISPDQAIAFYELAGSKGDGNAFRKLGDVFLNGVDGIAPDAQKSDEYYRKAVALYEQGIALENGGAARVLADMYKSGKVPGEERIKAIHFYESAAKWGDVQAMQTLGDLYSKGELVARPDFQKAAQYYEQAFNNGQTGSWLQLARTYLSSRNTVSQGIDLFEKNVAENTPNASVAYANEYISGQRIPANLPRAVEILKSATDNGDVNAARRLIQLYVEGKGRGFPPNSRAAKALLDRILPDLSESARAVDTLTVDAAFTFSGPSEFQDIVDRWRKLDKSDRISMLSQMGGINHNAYVAMMQGQLADLGYYAGELSGRLTSNTIKAFNLFCRDQNAASECAPGPLTGSSKRVLMRVLSEKE